MRVSNQRKLEKRRGILLLLLLSSPLQSIASLRKHNGIKRRGEISSENRWGEGN